MISKVGQNIEFGYISFTHELLKVIFELSLVNFKEKKSAFTFDKNFREMFQKNKISNSQEFYNFIFELNDELNSIDQYLSNSSFKKDFKRKDIHLDTLLDSVNNCLSYYDKSINYNTLFNYLSGSFLSLIKKGEIANNSRTKEIVREFTNYINSSLEYINNIKNNLHQTLEEKKVNENETDELKKQIQVLEVQLTDYKTKYQTKEIECQEEKKKKEEAIEIIKNEKKQIEKLDGALNDEKIQRELDKSTYEEIRNSLQNQINEMKNRFDEMDLKYSKELNYLKDENKKIQKKYERMEKENEKSKIELDITKKKVQILQDMANAQRNDINFLVHFAADFSHQLDDVLENLNNILHNLSADNILLDAISFLFN